MNKQNIKNLKKGSMVSNGDVFGTIYLSAWDMVLIHWSGEENQPPSYYPLDVFWMLSLDYNLEIVKEIMNELVPLIQVEADYLNELVDEVDSLRAKNARLHDHYETASIAGQEQREAMALEMATLRAGKNELRTKLANETWSADEWWEKYMELESRARRQNDKNGEW